MKLPTFYIILRVIDTRPQHHRVGALAGGLEQFFGSVKSICMSESRVKAT